MKKILFGVFISTIVLSCNDAKKEEAAATPAAATETKMAATEILDPSEGKAIQDGYAAFAKQDFDGATAAYDDNVRHYAAAGDSLIGKEAVKGSYKELWQRIDSIEFSPVIVLPVKINESTAPQYARVGKWAFSWAFVHVKYKNAKRLNFWMHQDYHYGDNGKVDQVVQYIDRAPIMEATKDMMKK